MSYEGRRSLAAGCSKEMITGNVLVSQEETGYIEECGIYKEKSRERSICGCTVGSPWRWMNGRFAGGKLIKFTNVFSDSR